MFISKEDLEKLKTIQQDHINAITKIDLENQHVIKDISKHDERLSVLEKHLETYLAQKAKKESEQPYIEILSQSFDEKLGLELKLDWNEAMINYLKRNGYRGHDDEDIVMRYASDIFNEKAKIKDAPESIA